MPDILTALLRQTADALDTHGTLTDDAAAALLTAAAAAWMLTCYERGMTPQAALRAYLAIGAHSAKSLTPPND